MYKLIYVDFIFIYVDFIYRYMDIYIYIYIYIHLCILWWNGHDPIAATNDSQNPGQAPAG